jgi:hypothetical protein
MSGLNFDCLLTLTPPPTTVGEISIGSYHVQARV